MQNNNPVSDEIISQINQSYPVSGTDWLWNEITGRNQANEAFKNQIAYQESFYNQYQSPAAMVRQYREAGLNPNLIGGQTSPSPVSSQAPVAKSGAEALAGVAGAVQGVGSLFQNAQTIEQNAKRLQNDIDVSQFGKRLTEAQTYAAFMKGGFDSELALGAAISNYWANDQNIADLAIKKQNRKNMEAEWRRIQANTDFINKQISRYDEMIDAEIDLKTKQAIEAEKHAFQMEQSAKQIQMENDFFEKWKYHSDSPVDVGLRNRWQNGDFSEYDNMLDFVLSYGYNMSYNQGLGNAISSRFGKMSIWEVPAEIVHRVDELLKDTGIIKHLDNQSQDAVEGLKSDLHFLGDLLKQAFDFIQEDNIYNGAGSDGNKPLYAQ